jgi:hypothetical protein
LGVGGDDGDVDWFARLLGIALFGLGG